MEENFEKNIVLIGMPGVGKTFIGSKLAKLLVHFSYIDIDELVEKKAGLNIKQIFETHSEEYFRKLESEVIKEVSAKGGQIISTGGGVAENPENIRRLKENGIIFYLKAPLKEIFNRICNQTHRPLLQENFSLRQLQAILKKRENGFKKADVEIDTEKKPAYSILNDIIGGYENYVRKNN